MDDALAKRGRSLEEAFFMERDAQLIAQRKKLEAMKKNKEVLAQVSGIHDEKILDKFVELEISPSVLASLSMLPLVEVAWADGELSDAEKKAVLQAAVAQGINEHSESYVMLDAWLKKAPSAQMLEVWIHYIQGLKKSLSPEQMTKLKSELLDRAYQVANASGGLLGIVAKVSAEEKAVLKKMEDAFAGS